MFYRILLGTLLATTMVLAQGRGGGGGDMGGGDSGGGGGGMGGGGGAGMGPAMTPHIVNRIDSLADMLSLNKDQKKQVKSILDESQKEANPVRDQLSKAQQAIGDAILAGKPDDELKPMINASATLLAQMADIEMNAFAKVYKSLEKEQVAHTRDLFPMMKGIFLGKNWNNPE